MSAPDVARGARYVTDGGLETDLIFHHDVDLPDFAAFVLIDDGPGRTLLRDYYRGYGEVARAHGVSLRLESATWRASQDWGPRLGYDAAALRRVNIDAVRLLHELAAEFRDLPEVRLVGTIGPRGDGYESGSWDTVTGADDALTYHRAQVGALSEAGVHVIAAYTLTDPAEAIGIVRAAREAGMPVEISFTVETDGRLASGSTLEDVIHRVDATAPPDGYLLNCAHPEHLGRAVGPTVAGRIIGIRPNASRLSHAELDDSDRLHEGDPEDLAACTVELLDRLPAVRVIGGCCGTDVRHIAKMWQRLSAEPSL
ncbi:homocysteine S-methyltransferase family protein [Microbacterium sp. LWH12-1.2]|uniref:homocysteine S-methyltransferase family protein n=1 Tax=Microbacterium sp. LWH12-1.2 TaxID=3135259 RepID=UPI00343123BD